MKQVLIMAIIIIGLFTIVAGCSDDNKKKLNIMIDDEIIYFVKLDSVNNIYNDNKIDIFKEKFQNKDIEGAKLIEFGERVYLDFDGNKPDKIEIKDNIITPEGKYMYDDKTTVIVKCESNDNGYYFLVNKNPASALSSLYEKGKTDLRGYRIKASWSDEEILYTFVIKTIATN